MLKHKGLRCAYVLNDLFYNLKHKVTTFCLTKQVLTYIFANAENCKIITIGTIETVDTIEKTMCTYCPYCS